MPRGLKSAVVYTGKCAKIHDRIVKLETELQSAKSDLKAAHKAQLAEDKLSAKQKAKDDEAKIMKAIKESGKSVEEILAALNK